MSSRARRTDADRPANRRASREDRRAVFIEAATAAIRRDGPGASMEAIAREAGVTKPILYRIFGDRDGLVEALGLQFGTELVERLDAELKEAGGRGRQDPRAVVEATIDAYVQMVDRDNELYRFITERTAQSKIDNLIDLISRDVAVTLGDALRTAGQDSGAAEPWAFGLVGMVHAAADWWVERRTMPREQLVAYLADLAWNGMASFLTPPEGSPPDV